MYAVFKSGGKQYRVSEGQIVRIEKLNNAAGQTVEFDQIMMIVDNENIQIGSPLVHGSKIIAQVVDHNRDDKVIIIKFRRRKHFRKHQGHRQWFTNIKIMSIHSSSESR